MSQTTVNGVRHVSTRTAIELSRVYVADFQKAGTKTAELKQQVITDSYYPSKKVESSMQNGLFSTAEFGFTEQHFQNIETRVAWILVPEHATEEQVLAELAKANTNKAVIYKVMDNAPILDENQQYAIKIGQRTMDDFANRQIIRYSDQHESMPGQICLTNSGAVQYKRTFFWNGPKNDVDNRGKGQVYMSPEIAAEIGGVQAVAAALTGQTIMDGSEAPAIIANEQPVANPVVTTV